MSAPERSHGRTPADPRPIVIEPGFVATAAGSVLMSQGETRVICTASVQESVPKWMAGRGTGWVTAEYAMLPASTGSRKARDITKGRQDGRGVEIQRLIGRSLRGVVDFAALGERTIYLDCDVLTADGGTRCASITGAFVALELACRALVADGRLERLPLNGSVAAISCGVVDGTPLCDLDYREDARAEVDANVVMTGDGALIEVQATAERTPLSRAHLDELLELAARRHRAPPRRADRRGGERRMTRAARSHTACCVRFVLATRNAHKAAEFADMLAPHEVDALPADVTLPPEDGETFAENALGKARAAAAATGRVAIADDSGIESAALGGRPGVRSARFAGEDATDEGNLAKLLDEAPAGSAVAYVCALAYVDPADGTEHVVEGRCTGTLAAQPRGDGGVRLRPRVRPRRSRRRPDDGGDHRRGEGCDQPPRARGARSAGLAQSRRLIAALAPTASASAAYP
ncbi:ribonuclease PH [Svornostia abyssi]|uniref:Ribonuclease PH n=1 Tax=Svornostia abyssi TaxID=2898438 RepID=A0ABY5PER7_9ACTN|nr:ribonuclease PH [Parviterribacteraceae bacterium J379]